MGTVQSRFSDIEFSDNLWFSDYFTKKHFSFYYMKAFNLVTIYNLVTVLRRPKVSLNQDCTVIPFWWGHNKTLTQGFVFYLNYLIESSTPNFSPIFCLMCGSSHIRSVLIGVEYRNFRQTLDVYLLLFFQLQSSALLGLARSDWPWLFSSARLSFSILLKIV